MRTPDRHGAHGRHASYYAAIVAEKAQLRRLVEAGIRIIQLGYQGGAGAGLADVVDRA